MRVHVKRVVQVSVGVFLVLVLYLNMHVMQANVERRSPAPALPWGHAFHDQHSPLKVLDQKFHPHLKQGLNASRLNHNASAQPRPGTQPLNPELDIYPSQQKYSYDRIPSQLKFVAQSVQEQRRRGERVKAKKIFLYNGAGNFGVKLGDQRLKDDKCAVQDCEMVDDMNKLSEADVVLFKSAPYEKDLRQKNLRQAWVIFQLESPYHSPHYGSMNSMFNWTATYRHDSTLVAPYERYVPLNDSLLTRPPTKNYAKGKTKKVAWFVSNCGARNGRLEYAKELGKHIEVDIYGGCGTKQCPRSQGDRCFDMLTTTYKFYLAFENSNCRDYITEKFFINGLKHDVIPIAMGAAPEDYRRAAPPHSFIHVDDFESAQHLAAYLHKLDQDDTLFNQYFAWKDLWTNINTFFWCRVCQLAHDIDRRGPSWFTNLDKWWRGPGVCIDRQTWREKPPVPGALIADLAVGGHTL